MKPTTFLLCLVIILSSCAKPSYKKNKILKSNVDSIPKEIVEEVIVNQKLSADQQILTALMAAPTEGREGATVYGYSESGEFMTLRQGTNEFICVADDPNKDGFQTVCYHKSLEPMMARGRALTKEGKSRNEKETIREKEAKSGKMSLPESAATLHIFYGKTAKLNYETGLVENAKYRYVVYIPYATQESTGLSLSPNESSHPWLMFPGKYNAHIMITPSN